MHEKYYRKNEFVEHVRPANSALFISLWVQKVPGSISDSGKGFYVWFFCFVVVVFYFMSKNILFVKKTLQIRLQFNLLSILSILQDLWPIIKV